MSDFITQSEERRFEAVKTRFLDLYIKSQDLGSELAEKIIPLQEVVIKNINARAELAEAVDERDYKEALKAEEELLKSIAEVTILLDELNQAGKTE